MEMSGSLFILFTLEIPWYWHERPFHKWGIEELMRMVVNEQKQAEIILNAENRARPAYTFKLLT